MPFESGNRIIKFFTEQGNDNSYVFDLPLLQEDALVILKYILNDQALKNKEVQFLSGTRVNDKRTWKSTGFAFVLDCTDRTALKDAIQNVMNTTASLTENKTPIFEFKENDKGILIIVYAEIDKLVQISTPETDESETETKTEEKPKEDKKEDTSKKEDKKEDTTEKEEDKKEETSDEKSKCPKCGKNSFLKKTDKSGKWVGTCTSCNYIGNGTN